MNSTDVGKTQCCSQDHLISLSRDRDQKWVKSIPKPCKKYGPGLRLKDYILWSWLYHGLKTMWIQFWLRLKWAGLDPRASCALVEEHLTWCFRLAYVINELETVQNLNYFLFIVHNNDSYFQVSVIFWITDVSIFSPSVAVLKNNVNNVISAGFKDLKLLNYSVMLKKTILLEVCEWDKAAVKPVIAFAAFHIFWNLFTRKYKDPLSHFHYLFLQAWLTCGCRMNKHLSLETNKLLKISLEVNCELWSK